MKIGIYGGTFNPIHLGHLRTAEEIRQRFALREIIFVPSARPPHKQSPEIVDGSHRLKMAALAVTGNPCFSVSDLEVRRGGKSYSLDTLRELKKLHPESNLAFICGRDAFLEIHTWHKYRELFAAADFIVTSRPGSKPRALSQTIPPAARREFRRQKKTAALVHVSGKTVTFTEVTGLDISSTLIRRFIREGLSPRYLIPRRVGEYIIENRLYQK